MDTPPKAMPPNTLMMRVTVAAGAGVGVLGCVGDDLPPQEASRRANAQIESRRYMGGQSFGKTCVYGLRRDAVFDPMHRKNVVLRHFTIRIRAVHRLQQPAGAGPEHPLHQALTA